MRTKTPQINRLAQLVRFLRVSHLFLWMIWVIYREHRRVVRAHTRGNSVIQLDNDAKDAFLAFITRDARSLVEALSELGFIDAGANLVSIERAMALMIGRYYGMTLGEVRELDIPEMLQDVQSLLYEQSFHIPAQLAFIGRAAGILVSISTGLALEFDFVEVATPYARKFLGLDAEGVEQTLKHLFSQMLDAGRAWLSLPRSLEQVMTRLETGQIEVKLASNGRSGWRCGRERERRSVWCV